MIKKENLIKQLNLLHILKLMIVAPFIFINLDTFYTLIGVWVITFIISELPLRRFCKNGSMIRYGNASDEDPDNKDAIKSSYDSYLWTIIISLIIMIAVIIKYFI